MSDTDEAAYIAVTARGISERLLRLRDQGMPITGVYLAEDVAWIARQLAELAEYVAAQRDTA